MTCKYCKICKNYRSENRACKDIDTNPDEFTCGTYRGFDANSTGLLDGIRRMFKI